MAIDTTEVLWNKSRSTSVNSKLVHLGRDIKQYLQNRSGMAYTLDEIADEFQIVDYMEYEPEYSEETELKHGRSDELKNNQENKIVISDVLKDVGKDVLKNATVTIAGEAYKKRLIKYFLVMLQREGLVEVRDIAGRDHYTFRV